MHPSFSARGLNGRSHESITKLDSIVKLHLLLVVVVQSFTLPLSLSFFLAFSAVIRRRHDGREFFPRGDSSSRCFGCRPGVERNGI
jgi:hypothetical protein